MMKARLSPAVRSRERMQGTVALPNVLAVLSD
jgi:hypothetical protein